MKIATYYRTPLLVEELDRMGYSLADIHEIVAKQFYLQYWSGQATPDKHVFNPMVRSFYPGGSWISTGSTDLGRETELQAAKLYAMGVEGKKPPVLVINTGDTGIFTDGTMHLIQHVVEGLERGFDMPVVFLTFCNNSAISARIDYGAHDDDPMYGVRRVEQRFKTYGDIFVEGGVTSAGDVAGGIESFRGVVDRVV